MERLVLKNITEDLIVEECFGHFQKVELDHQTCSHCSEHCHRFVNKQGLDIYGQKIDNHDANGELVECPVCKKSVAAARFAPHLEKCLGLGRNSRPKRAPKPSETDNGTILTDAPVAETESKGDDPIVDESSLRPKKRKKSVSGATK